MNPQAFIHCRQTFHERLLAWANILSDDKVPDNTRMEIVAEREGTVKATESLETPPTPRKLLVADFGLLGSRVENNDDNIRDRYELIVEADASPRCSKDGTIRDTLSWVSELLKKKHASTSDLAVILKMLAWHVERLRMAPVESVLVDPYADEMDDLAKRRYESRPGFENEYLETLWSRLYNCIDCICDQFNASRP